ncbi:MAG TPA: gamma-glutamylcyclotransferase [Candidatus Hydrogenedentes bacterium]|nr:gamma-glutamylcyclotransferase [Candidatus Hydrogenedentota bacterium]HOV74818.1 gamma-glutamylcyclotransferase [Candidatus Hydrogenedentota bacterium]
MTFDDPEERLPRLDQLEGCRPGGLGLYNRVLLPIQAGCSVLPAWLYVGNHTVPRDCRPLPLGNWPH